MDVIFYHVTGFLYLCTPLSQTAVTGLFYAPFYVLNTQYDGNKN